LIDWYNIQYYNQGASSYVSCNTLFNKAGSWFPGTSIFELNESADIPLYKLVVGKPALSSDASNGYMSASALSECMQDAQEKGWNGGMMVWQYPNANTAWISHIRGDVFPILDTVECAVDEALETRSAEDQGAATWGMKRSSSHLSRMAC
jgi:hypothetical protein